MAAMGFGGFGTTKVRFPPFPIWEFFARAVWRLMCVWDRESIGKGMPRAERILKRSGRGGSI